MRNIATTLQRATPLMFTGMAVAFAFRAGLFNIGAEGNSILAPLLQLGLVSLLLIFPGSSICPWPLLQVWQAVHCGLP